MSEQPVAVVTAAGQGIGAACARALAKRGYRLALMSRSGASMTLAEELGGVGMNGSVTETADLEALVNHSRRARWLHQALRGSLRARRHSHEQRATRVHGQLADD